jgi:osmotically-inducible protein OsmY
VILKLKLNRLAAAAAAALLALAGGALQGCAVVAVGGAAAGGAAVATDRRSANTQMADQIIELRADKELTDALNRRGHVSIVSYYRKVLLTGEVETPEDRARAQAVVAAVPDVVGVINELAVMPESSLGQRSTDTLITTRVKAGLLNADGVPGNSIKVVTDRSIVYLMGRLTRRETELATEITRTVDGVERVVRVIDFISEQAAYPNDPGAGAARSPAPAPVTDAGGVETHPVK